MGVGGVGVGGVGVGGVGMGVGGVGGVGRQPAWSHAEGPPSAQGSPAPSSGY